MEKENFIRIFKWDKVPFKEKVVKEHLTIKKNISQPKGKGELFETKLKITTWHENKEEAFMSKAL